MPATNRGGNLLSRPKARLRLRLISQPRTTNLICPPVLKAHRAELSAPQTAGVQREQIRLRYETQRRPVPAYDCRCGALPSWHGEPGQIACGNITECALVIEFHAAVRFANAQARHCVDDDPVAVVAGQRIVPVVGVV